MRHCKNYINPFANNQSMMKKELLPLAIITMIIASLTGCTFFAGPTGPITPNATSQWAISATASSSYGGIYGANRDDNSPYAATGEPDVAVCGDSLKAWAPKDEDDDEQWIELKYYDEVYASQIRVYESSGVGAIRKIEVKDGTDYVVFWEGTYKARPCPYVLDTKYKTLMNNITLNMTEFLTDTVRITLDTDVEGWNEIDAVQLIGYYNKWYIFNNTLWIE
jgi:hypothetical protein